MIRCWGSKRSFQLTFIENLVSFLFLLFVMTMMMMIVWLRSCFQHPVSVVCLSSAILSTLFPCAPSIPAAHSYSSSAPFSFLLLSHLLLPVNSTQMATYTHTHHLKEGKGYGLFLPLCWVRLGQYLDLGQSHGPGICTSCSMTQVTVCLAPSSISLFFSHVGRAKRLFDLECV